MVIEMKSAISAASSPNTSTPASPTFLFLFCTKLVLALPVVASVQKALPSHLRLAAPFLHLGLGWNVISSDLPMPDHPVHGAKSRSCFSLMGFLFWVLITTEDLVFLF